MLTTISTNDLILPLIPILISIVALWFAIRYNIANRRPHLIFSEEQIVESEIRKTGFYLRNIGLGPAFNIEIPDMYIQKHEFLKAFHEIPRNIPPDGATLFHIIHGDHRYITNNLVISVTYEDHQGRKYQTTLQSMKHSFKRIWKA